MKPSQYIEAIVGKHNLNIQDEIGSATYKVWTVIVHPDWDPINFSFDADVALIVLRKPVELILDLVQIIGLSRSSEELTGSGTVVGWGKSERSEAIGNDYDYAPNKIDLPVVSQTEFFRASKDLQATASNRTFCAGFIDQSTAVCVGDSGSGFYRFVESNRRYELAGIVSASVKDPFRLCEIELYSLFTNVAKFISWIDRQMETTKEIKWKNVIFYCNLHPRS